MSSLQKIKTKEEGHTAYKEAIWRIATAAEERIIFLLLSHAFKQVCVLKGDRGEKNYYYPTSVPGPPTLLLCESSLGLRGLERPVKNLTKKPLASAASSGL